MAKPGKTLTKATKPKSVGIVETQLPTFSESLVLVRKGAKPKPETLRPREIAGTLVAETLDALSNPGISRNVVFRGRAGSQVSSYSVWPKDPTMMVREHADGTRTIGRVVGGKFRARPTSK